MAPLFQQPFMSGGFPSMNRAAAAAVGGWVELGRTTLGSAADTITVSSLADKRYYMILGHTVNTGGDTVTHIRANGDSGANYAQRRSKIGLADVLANPTTVFYTSHNSKTIDSRFIQGYIANYSTKEKLGIFQTNENPATGAATAPSRIEGVGKHAQTSNPINELQFYNDEAGSFDTGGELVVLGWDPADTHTNNFWEELDSVTLGSAGDTLQSNTFTAKKYLWIQYFLQGSTTDLETQITFNADSGSNYTQRRSQNGAADITSTSQAKLEPITSKNSYNYFGNMFFINNASNEKLGIHHSIEQNTAGAANAPNRHEGVMKWANTSNQITSIKIFNGGTADYEAGTILKVFGSD